MTPYEEESDDEVNWGAPCIPNYKKRKLNEENIDHQKCPAGHTARAKCILRELVLNPVREHFYPELIEEAKETYPECSFRIAERKMINDKLPELRKLARFYVSEVVEYIQNIDKCPMYSTLVRTMRQIQQTSHVSSAVAIREAVRLHKADLNQFFIEPKSEEEHVEDDNDSDGTQEAFDVRRTNEL